MDDLKKGFIMITFVFEQLLLWKMNEPETQIPVKILLQ